MTGAFEILNIDPEKKRIGVALVDEGTVRAKAKHEAADVREYAAREEAAPAETFGSLAGKLRGALKPRG